MMRIECRARREVALALRDKVGELATALQGLSGMAKMALFVARFGKEHLDNGM